MEKQQQSFPTSFCILPSKSFLWAKKLCISNWYNWLLVNLK